MNRHFEFRVWNKKLQKFVAQAALGEIRGANINNGLFGVTFTSDETVNETQNYKDCVIQEFTGAFDVNGVQIFEGDVVSYLDYKQRKVISPVIWSAPSFVVLDINGDESGPNDLLQGAPEIIGNIFAQ